MTPALPSLPDVIWTQIRGRRTLAIITSIGLVVAMLSVAVMTGVTHFDGTPTPLADIASELRLFGFMTAMLLFTVGSGAAAKWMIEQRRDDRVRLAAVAVRGTLLGAIGDVPRGSSSRATALIEPDVSVIALPLTAGLAAAALGFALAMDVALAYAGHGFAFWTRRLDATFHLFVLCSMLLAVLASAGRTSRAVYAWASDRAAAAAEAVAEAERARLSALRVQMTPQFLFGALETIESCAVADPLRAERIVEELSVMLRHSLQRSSRPFSTVENEVRFACEFLDVERSRSGSHMTVTTEIEPATADLLVPTMCLQPIVENAIVHAMRGRPATGHIRISASLDGGGYLLRLWVVVKFERFYSFCMHERMSMHLTPTCGRSVRPE